MKNILLNSKIKRFAHTNVLKLPFCCKVKIFTLLKQKTAYQIIVSKFNFDVTKLYHSYFTLSIYN